MQTKEIKRALYSVFAIFTILIGFGIFSLTSVSAKESGAVYRGPNNGDTGLRPKEPEAAPAPAPEPAPAPAPSQPSQPSQPSYQEPVIDYNPAPSTPVAPVAPVTEAPKTVAPVTRPVAPAQPSAPAPVAKPSGKVYRPVSKPAPVAQAPEVKAAPVVETRVNDVAPVVTESAKSEFVPQNLQTFPGFHAFLTLEDQVSYAVQNGNGAALASSVIETCYGERLTPAQEFAIRYLGQTPAATIVTGILTNYIVSNYVPGQPWHN